MMITRAREIAQMMGYNSADATLEAIGRGELILVKVPDDLRLRFADWLRAHAAEARAEDPALGDVVEDVANGLEMALELIRYPADTDVCDMNLPHGWPSYCDKSLRLK